MKMEHTVAAPIDGVVTTLCVAPGDQVETRQVLAVIDDAPLSGNPSIGERR
jgi:biotin carboxyl carrier protein